VLGITGQFRKQLTLISSYKITTIAITKNVCNFRSLVTTAKNEPTSFEAVKRPQDDPLKAEEAFHSVLFLFDYSYISAYLAQLYKEQF
jgi:hypothetical protein